MEVEVETTIIDEEEEETKEELVRKYTSDRKQRYTQRYRQDWEEDKRFSGWLQAVPGEPTKARCSVCSVYIQAHIKSLIGHSAAKKHKDSMIRLARGVLKRPSISSGRNHSALPGWETVSNDNNLIEIKIPPYDKDADVSPSTKRQMKNLSKWISKDKYKDWLLPVAEDSSKLSCKYCSTIITARTTEIERHYKTKKHQINTDGYTPESDSQVQYIQAETIELNPSIFVSDETFEPSLPQYSQCINIPNSPAKHSQWRRQINPSQNCQNKTLHASPGQFVSRRNTTTNNDFSDSHFCLDAAECSAPNGETCVTYGEEHVYPNTERASGHSLQWTKAMISRPAPNWDATAVVNGQFKQLSLSDYKGKYLVFFFYPLDFTFVCPTEILAFNDRVKEFRDLNVEVVACSVDSHFTHLAWTKTPRKQGGLGTLQIPLVSDITKKISKDYGVYLEDQGIALRGLFIIDDKGILRQMTLNDLPVGRSVDETLRLVQAFQYTDKHGEVCPAGWKPGKATIVPDPDESLRYFSTANREL